MGSSFLIFGVTVPLRREANLRGLHQCFETGLIVYGDDNARYQIGGGVQPVHPCPSMTKSHINGHGIVWNHQDRNRVPRFGRYKTLLDKRLTSQCLQISTLPIKMTATPVLQPPDGLNLTSETRSRSSDAY